MESLFGPPIILCKVILISVINEAVVQRGHERLRRGGARGVLPRRPTRGDGRLRGHRCHTCSYT